MPPMPSVEGVIKLEVMGNISGNTQFANVFHLGQSGGPWTSGEMYDVYVGFAAHLADVYANNAGTAVTVTEVKMTDLTSDTGAVLVEDVDWVGTRSGISAQASACVLTSWAIPRRYRGGHPRTYWPLGDAALQATPQSWDEAFIAACNTDIENFVISTTSVSAEAALGCVSYYSGGVLRETPLFQAFTAYNTDVGIRSQRRRLTSTTP